MTAYLLTGPESAGHSVKNGVSHAVVEAQTADLGKLIAAGITEGDSDAYWLASTAEAIAASAGWAGWSLGVKISDTAGLTVLEEKVSTPLTYEISTAAVHSGNPGAGYHVNDIATITGTGHPATLKVASIGAGVPTAITKTTSGSYTVNPAGSDVATAGGSGTGLKVDLGTSGGGGPYTLGTVAIHTGHEGSGYAAGDVVNVPATGGGTAGTITITTVDNVVGSVLTFTMLDHGAYTVNPTGTAILTTSTGGGTGLKVDTSLVQGGPAGDIDQLGLAMVTALNASGPITHAAYNESTNVLTVAGTADNLGDHKLTISLIEPNGVGSIASLVGSIVDGGSAGAALTVALPADNASIPAILGLMTI